MSDSCSASKQGHVAGLTVGNDAVEEAAPAAPASQPADLFAFDAPLPWWGEHDAVLDEDLSVELPPEWNVSGDLFLVWAPGMTRVVAWPRETHALRVAQITRADLSCYDAEARQELEAEVASNLVSRVEYGRLEVTPQMAQAIAWAGAFEDSAADGASPDEASSGEAAPNGVVPSDAPPSDAAPNGVVPNDAAPSDSVASGAPSSDSTLCDVAPSLPVEATVLGMQDHLEIWNRTAFKAYVRGIDLSAYCE